MGLGEFALGLGWVGKGLRWGWVQLVLGVGLADFALGVDWNLDRGFETFKRGQSISLTKKVEGA